MVEATCFANVNRNRIQFLITKEAEGYDSFSRVLDGIQKHGSQIFFGDVDDGAGKEQCGIIMTFDENKEEKAPDETMLMTFGKAIEALKRGERVQRNGWNGKGMYLILAYPRYASEAKPASIEFNQLLPGMEGSHLENFIVMKTADNKLVPWLASQTDILSEDWNIIH